jgi:hypothetical protein
LTLAAILLPQGGRAFARDDSTPAGLPWLPHNIRGTGMDSVELLQIEQRIQEGYYEADADALRVMRRLLDEVRRFREEISSPAAELPA